MSSLDLNKLPEPSFIERDAATVTSDMVAQAEAQERAAEAAVDQAQAMADAAAQKLARSEQLVKTNAVSQQVF